MKLAEALQERADLNRKITSLRGRLENVVLVQEGEEPVENPRELLGELDESVARLEYLMAAINHTNDVTEADGMTLTQLIAKKDALMQKAAVYRGMVQEAGSNTGRARGTEIRVIPAVLLLPFSGVIAGLAEKMIPGKPEDQEESDIEKNLRELDMHLISNPAIALNETSHLIGHMSLPGQCQRSI